MLLSHHKLIYLHPPKTAGNSIQAALLPYSDDELVLGGHRDGHDRFEIVGSAADHKHATLQEYSDNLGEELGGYQIAISVRHPVERMVSLYFSPHRWLRLTEGRHIRAEPVWDMDEFVNLIEDALSLGDFLRLGSITQKPDYILRHAALQTDFQAMCESVGISAESLDVRNQSAGSSKLRAALVQNVDVIGQVKRVFIEDFAIFEGANL